MKQMKSNTSGSLTLSSDSGRRGSVSVFLLMIMAVMLSFTLVVISVAENVTAVSYCDSLIHSAGRSVLSEYDPGLKEDYGLFAFRGTTGEIEDAMQYYIGYTLAQNDKLHLSEVTVDTSDYSFTACDPFEEAVLEFTSYAIAKGLINGSVPLSGGGEGKNVDKEESGKTLENVRESLPSAAASNSSGLISAVKNALSGEENILVKGGKNYMVNRYIMDKFKNAQDQDIGRDTFLKYEAEYIVEGRANDDKNRKEFRSEVVALRNVINFAYIYSNARMRTEIIAIAQAISPGAVGIVTQLALAETWALLEAENDMKLLERGKKVPPLKTEASWALDADTLIHGVKEGVVDPGNQTGFTYEGYLQAFLLMMDKETKYARMMDLMQLNLQQTRDSSFVAKEHNFGFRVNAVINGRKYAYEHKY